MHLVTARDIVHGVHYSGGLGVVILIMAAVVALLWWFRVSRNKRPKSPS